MEVLQIFLGLLGFTLINLFSITLLVVCFSPVIFVFLAVIKVLKK